MQLSLSLAVIVAAAAFVTQALAAADTRSGPSNVRPVNWSESKLTNQRRITPCRPCGIEQGCYAGSANNTFIEQAWSEENSLVYISEEKDREWYVLLDSEKSLNIVNICPETDNEANLFEVREQKADDPDVVVSHWFKVQCHASCLSNIATHDDMTGLPKSISNVINWRKADHLVKGKGSNSKKRGSSKKSDKGRKENGSDNPSK